MDPLTAPAPASTSTSTSTSASTSTSTTSSRRPDTDPDPDLFDAIVLADNEFRGKGYREGFIEGSQLGETEGRRYGLANGAKLGSEVSFYKGFTITWKSLLQNNPDTKNSKRLKVLNSMLEMVHSFPYEDPTNDRLQEDLEKMRAKFKQICSLLNIQPTLHKEKAAAMSF
ncbi:protein LTO1 homolog [Leucoraja erinacea]|uniref:protein LTO1 homolog n=1 Tax=Leucoraja erinaceus TaxID=7782 RepID=UPI0024569E98|nr:protein LTO1 homolog [Leucoraja erinacea]